MALKMKGNFLYRICNSWAAKRFAADSKFHYTGIDIYPSEYDGGTNDRVYLQRHSTYKTLTYMRFDLSFRVAGSKYGVNNIGFMWYCDGAFSRWWITVRIPYFKTVHLYGIGHMIRAFKKKIRKRRQAKYSEKYYNMENSDIQGTDNYNP